MTDNAQPLHNAVVFKKYGNRRLYDTNTSRYVTLQEVEAMVQRGIDIQVLDAKTNEDLTKEILVQIILDKEGAREILPTGFLKQVVRLSASPMKDGFSKLLSDTLEGLASTQRAMFDAQKSVVGGMLNMSAQAGQRAASAFAPPSFPQAPVGWNPFAAFSPPAGQLNIVPQAAPPADVHAQHDAAQDRELDRLRAEVSETQALLRQLIAAQAPAADSKKKAKRRAAR